MTPATSRLLANVLLSIAVVILVVELCGMFGWIPKYLPPSQLSGLVLILAIVAASLRRRARAPKAPQG